MSQAYAELCSGDVLVMTDNPKNVNEKGIWGQVEKPTLQQTGNVGGQVNVVRIGSLGMISLRLTFLAPDRFHGWEW